MSTNYIVASPDGAITKRASKDGMTHAVIRKYENEMAYRVSLAGSLEKAHAELKNRAKAQHSLIVVIDENHEGYATDKSYVVFEDPAPAAESPRLATDDKAVLWEQAFKAGQDYALKCAFQGVVAPPANPYL